MSVVLQKRIFQLRNSEFKDPTAIALNIRKILFAR